MSDTKITVSCAHCRTPVARITPEGLVITSRHHGRRHVTTISLERLAELLAEAQPEPS